MYKLKIHPHTAALITRMMFTWLNELLDNVTSVKSWHRNEIHFGSKEQIVEYFAEYEGPNILEVPITMQFTLYNDWVLQRTNDTLYDNSFNIRFDIAIYTHYKLNIK